MLFLAVYLRGSTLSTLNSSLAARICFNYRAYSSKFSRASVYAAKKSVLPTKDISAQASADVRRIPDDIKTVRNRLLCHYYPKILEGCNARVSDITQYAFDSRGKMLRPLLVLLMAACANAHLYCRTLAERTREDEVHFFERQLSTKVTCSQHAIAIISEMIHTASLIHDDLIDRADTRRGKLATYKKFGNKKAVLAGNTILVKASELLAKLENAEVVSILSTVLDDLIRGEFMQLSSSLDENQRFDLYLEKSYKKTASLMANSCKAVTVLAGVDAHLVDAAFKFGRHLGMAFQLLDDMLDFIGQESKLGKPAGGSDLQLGLATGPVLFAAQEFPELEELLQKGVKSDKERLSACSFVHRSNAIGQTRILAEFHFQEAQRQLGYFRRSEAREYLLQVAGSTLQRNF
ncbi:unnamed protein product [Dibothriocephalus latus]|uniref:Decaprenyl-diphosphate synthase subunit 1 n=1 Tax=Dibothriocephalus latus TaxID=60516 RepID=A0A3P7LWK5_DIBLA|nr:unnamed protein product [Dibothriocephalus latus]